MVTVRTVTDDPHAVLCKTALERALNGAGESDAALRRAAADGAGLPEELQRLVTTIQQHAYKVTDADVAALQARYGDDRMFEIIVSAALGASRKRLLAGLKALEEA